MRKPQEIIFVVLLCGLSFFLHFWGLQKPSFVVFDEQWFLNFSASYYTQEYYFDIHPPLGKEIIAAVGDIFGFQPPSQGLYLPQNYETTNNYLPFRQVVALFGMLIPVIVYFILRKIKISPLYCAVGSLVVLFDNSILAQSRFVLIDSFLILFSLCAFLAYLYYYSENRPKQKFNKLIIFALFAGLAFSVKWIGGGVFLGFFACEFLRISRKRESFKPLLKNMAIIAAVAFTVYVVSFYPHFSILTKTRDLYNNNDPLLNADSTNILPIKNPHPYFIIPQGNFFQKFIKLNGQMLSVFTPVRHHYESKFYTWPFMWRPVAYAAKDGQYVYLIGNPIVWLLGILGLSAFISYGIYFLIQRLRRKVVILPKWLPILFCFYFCFWLPFIAISRSTFLYHYLIAFIISVIAAILFLDKGIPYYTLKQKRIVALILLLLVIATFLFMSPLTFGTNMTEKQFRHHMLIKSWI